MPWRQKLDRPPANLPAEEFAMDERFAQGDPASPANLPAVMG
jgi:hypothetical protein